MVTLTDRLGNEIAGYLQEQTTPAPPESGGFFGFLQFSPSSQRRGVTVEEFHQRNQEFLQQSEYARSKQKALRDNSPHRQYVNECVSTLNHIHTNVRVFTFFCLFAPYFTLGKWPRRLANGLIDLAFLLLTTTTGTKDRRNSRRTKVEQ
jgi:hypothetical protein